ncbi:MAG: hypothetical protein WCD86_09420 [Ktedonobacteraceae bacterium]
MSSYPVSLRNIPSEVMETAQAIAQHTGLSIADVYRLALASGVLVEATKITPDRTGTHAGLDGETLARALRRHLSSAIDLLIAFGEHPAPALLATMTVPSHAEEPRTLSPLQEPAREMAFDPTLGDELASLGIGLGFSTQWDGASRT